jgi:predicted small secreted protein
MAHAIVKVTGTVTFQDDMTGTEKTLKIKPFEACEASRWIDIVDEAAESCQPIKGDWIHIEEKIEETVLYGRGCTCGREKA